MDSLLIIILSKVNYDHYLVRELVKSVPRSGGEGDLIGAVEDIDERYTLNTGIGADIRQAAHRTLNASLLGMVRAYKAYYLTGEFDYDKLGRCPSEKETKLQNEGPQSEQFQTVVGYLAESERILERKFGDIRESGYLEEIKSWKDRLEKSTSDAELRPLAGLLAELQNSLSANRPIESIEILLTIRSGIKEVINLVSADERLALMQLDLFLEKICDTQFGKLTVELFKDCQGNLSRILRLTQVLVQLTLLSGIGGKHIEKFAELLTLPTLTYSMLRNLIKLILTDAQDIVTCLDRKYRKMAGSVLGKENPEKTEKALAELKRDAIDLNRLIEYLTNIEEFLKASRRYKHGEASVYKDRSRRLGNPLDDIIMIDSLKEKELDGIRFILYKYGGKATYFLYMRALGMPVPPGFIIPTTVAMLSKIMGFIP
jgi:hypothetical protein